MTLREWLRENLPVSMIKALNTRVRPRRIHVYGIGAGKTGTHSLYNIFAKSFRSAHEPQLAALARVLQQDDDGLLSREEKVEFLLERDARLCLEVDSSALNRRLASLLAELFPAALFIMTVRDPYTYVDSLMNHLLNQPPVTLREKNRREAIFGGQRFRHAPEEEPLRKAGLSTLDGYLSEYMRGNREVLDSLSPGRLLVVRTDRISASIDRIAAFVGVAPELLDAARSHAFKAQKKFGLLARLDPGFVDAKVALYCDSFMREWFPDIRSMDDVVDRLA